MNGEQEKGIFKLFFITWVLIILMAMIGHGAEYSVHLPPPGSEDFADSFSIVNSTGEVVWFCPYQELCNDLAESLNEAHERLQGDVLMTPTTGQ